MTLNALVANIYQYFQEQAAEARVVLLHAHSRYRTALIGHLLASSDQKVFYYAMGSDDVDIESFLAGLTHDLSEQVPTFGGHVNQVGFESELEMLVHAFTQDLNELSSEPYLLLLDEFDRADIADDLQQFLEMLLDQLPSQCRLVISSRNLPRLPWMSLIAQKKAVMLRDSDLIGSNFYENQAPTSEARLQILGLGPGTVIVDNQAIDAWEGHLPRLLLFFALERPMVTRSEICRAFWPDLSNDQAVNVFHVTKRRLHKALEALGVDILVHENGYYQVNPSLSVHYDVTDFVSALVDGRKAGGKGKMAAWQKALDMAQRPFLQGHSEGWILKRRYEYQTGYLEALNGMAEVRLAEGRPEQALSLLLKAVNADSHRQDLHRQVMRIYADLGRRSETASHYQRLQEILHSQGLTLEDETKTLYKELMNN